MVFDTTPISELGINEENEEVKKVVQEEVNKIKEVENNSVFKNDQFAVYYKNPPPVLRTEE